MVSIEAILFLRIPMCMASEGWEDESRGLSLKSCLSTILTRFHQTRAAILASGTISPSNSRYCILSRHQ